MRKIEIKASGSYDVLIGCDLLSQLGSHAVKLITGRKAAIISDQNVWHYYGREAVASLCDAGFSACHHIIIPGEKQKTLSTYGEILEFLASSQITREDVIIALGGGVVGDLAGFAAATYLRGIPFIQVPTTLLAMVDSSVGGKAAIDLPSGKNLAGAFYQPKLVLCDLNVLQTLPAEIFRDGCAEVLKYGVLFDADLFAHIADRGLAFNRESMIARCIEFKRDIVVRDEFENNERRLLNLGHTFGHAIEKLSGYNISHGNAVAIGIAMSARTAEKHDYCCVETVNKIIVALQKLGLPTNAPYTNEQLSNAMLTDKKRLGDTIQLVLPQNIGKCVSAPISISALQGFIKAGQ